MLKHTHAGSSCLSCVRHMRSLLTTGCCCSAAMRDHQRCPATSVNYCNCRQQLPPDCNTMQSSESPSSISNCRCAQNSGSIRQDAVVRSVCMSCANGMLPPICGPGDTCQAVNQVQDGGLSQRSCLLFVYRRFCRPAAANTRSSVSVAPQQAAFTPHTHEQLLSIHTLAHWSHCQAGHACALLISAKCAATEAGRVHLHPRSDLHSHPTGALCRCRAHSFVQYLALQLLPLQVSAL